ncbi:MAG: hypothetical protein ACRD2L_22815 [Terriglobia bacterium]
MQKEWKKTWECHLGQFQSGGASWANNRWREPFELIGASLIYTCNAMKLIPNCILHKSVRKAMPYSEKIWKLLSGSEPNFYRDSGKDFNALAATMHMASSSFRLLTALYLIEREILDKAKGPLTEMLKELPTDWERNKFRKYRDQAKQLKCCTIKTPLPIRSQKDAERIALAIILDHRDEFGHGEEGKKERSEIFNHLHLFRVLEAQLLLAELGVKELEQIK